MVLKPMYTLYVHPPFSDLPIAPMLFSMPVEPLHADWGAGDCDRPRRRIPVTLLLVELLDGRRRWKGSPPSAGELWFRPMSCGVSDGLPVIDRIRERMSVICGERERGGVIASCCCMGQTEQAARMPVLNEQQPCAVIIVIEPPAVEGQSPQPTPPTSLIPLHQQHPSSTPAHSHTTTITQGRWCTTCVRHRQWELHCVPARGRESSALAGTWSKGHCGGDKGG